MNTALTVAADQLFPALCCGHAVVVESSGEALSERTSACSVAILWRTSSGKVTGRPRRLPVGFELLARSLPGPHTQKPPTSPSRGVRSLLRRASASEVVSGDSPDRNIDYRYQFAHVVPANDSGDNARCGG